MEAISLTSQELKPILNIKAINSAYFYNFHKDFKGRPECHAPIELIYVDQGCQIVFEDNKKYKVEKGQAFLHRSLAIHSDQTNNVFTSVYILSFTCNSNPLEILYDKVLNLDNEDIYHLKEIFELIKREDFESKSPMFYLRNMKITISKESMFGNANKIKNKLELFIIDLLEKQGSDENNETKFSKSTNLLISELKAQTKDKLDLNAISKKLYYTKSYLCRKFKQDTGTTIVQYLYELKINQAKFMLLNTNKTLQEISNELSFESVQYFNYIFKKYAGLSPKQWQKVVAKPMYY